MYHLDNQRNNKDLYFVCIKTPNIYQISNHIKQSISKYNISDVICAFAISLNVLNPPRNEYNISSQIIQENKYMSDNIRGLKNL